ncbi:MAG: ABC transporter substrate-binding protein [Chloroflexota bacterium]
MLLAGFVGLLLAACGDSSAPAPSGASAPSTAKPAAPASAAASGAKTKMVAGYSVVSASQIQLWAPAEGGYFANEGLDVQVIKAGAGSVGMAALLSGDINIIITSSTSTMNAAVEGAPLVYIGSTLERIVQFMMARSDRADLTSGKDLKGHKVGVTTPGSNSDTAAHLVAKQAGLEEPKDYTIVRMNDIPTIQAAAQNGAIDLAMIDSAALAGAASGLKVVSDLTKSDVPFSTIGFTTTRSYYQQHPNEIKAFGRAYAAAVKRIKSDQAFTNKVLAQYLKIDDTKTLDAISAEFVPILDDELAIHKEGLENARMFASYSLPKLQQFDVGKIEP